MGMPMVDPVLWTLAGTTAATVLFLLDRRSKSRPSVLDGWARSRHMQVRKHVSLETLAPLEPLSLLPTVIGIERLTQGAVATPALKLSATLAVCTVSENRRTRQFLLAALGSHDELPPLRVLPIADSAAPTDRGFLALPAAGLPDGYRAEGFSPLRRDLTEALGTALTAAGPEYQWRVELRPGRLLLATPLLTTAAADRMLALGADLTQRFVALLGIPQPVTEPDEKGEGGCGSGGCGRCG